MTPWLCTPRLILRKLLPEDFADFCSWAADPQMCRMMGRELITDEESARPTFQWLLTHEKRAYALVLRESGRMVGNCTVTAPSRFVADMSSFAERRGCALSFSVGRPWQRRGLMQEALSAVIPALFDEGMDYISCGHFADNLASFALQRKLGFSPITEESLIIDGATVRVIENVLFSPTLIRR